MKKIYLLFTAIFFRPFYTSLHFFPFSIKVGKYPLYKQLQYLHFRLTHKLYTKPLLKKICIADAQPFTLETKPSADFLQFHLYTAGFYEKKLSLSVLQSLKNASVFIDVGAHIGYYTIMASKTFPDLQIYAFEPQMCVFDTLKKHTMHNHCSNVSLYNFALGSAQQTKTFFLHKYPEQSSFLNHDATNNQQFEAEIKTFDSLQNTVGKNIVIKIDTEGFEFEVLKGMNDLLKNNNCVIFMEFNPKKYLNFFNTDYTISCIKELEKMGYVFYRLDNSLFLYQESGLRQENLKIIYQNFNL